MTCDRHARARDVESDAGVVAVPIAFRTPVHPVQPRVGLSDRGERGSGCLASMGCGRASAGQRLVNLMAMEAVRPCWRSSSPRSFGGAHRSPPPRSRRHGSRRSEGLFRWSRVETTSLTSLRTGDAFPSPHRSDDCSPPPPGHHVLWCHTSRSIVKATDAQAVASRPHISRGPGATVGRSPGWRARPVARP